MSAAAPVRAAGPSSISISVSLLTATLGESVTVTGTIAPAVPGVEVTLKYTRPDGTQFTRKATTSMQSSYADAYTPESVGTWTVVASWSGNDQFAGATSSSVSFMVVELPSGTSAITCMTDFSSSIVGSSIKIFGVISPAQAVPITIQLSPDGGASWNSLTTVVSASDGTFQYQWVPSSVGSYVLRATWLGDSGHAGATSSQVSVVVHFLHAPDFSVSADPSSRIIKAGETTTFTVTITSLYGFNSSVTLATSGLPANAGGSFNPPSVSGNGTSILTVSTSDSTPQGTSTVTISATAGEQARSAAVSLEVTAAEKPPSPTVPFIGVPEILLAILLGLFVVARTGRRKRSLSMVTCAVPNRGSWGSGGNKWVNTRYLLVLLARVAVPSIILLDPG